MTTKGVPVNDSEVLERLLNDRYSCRAFRPEGVDRATVMRMFAIAQRTPSWCNTQPWQAAVTSGEATERLRKRLYEAASTQSPTMDLDPPQAYNGAYDDRRRETGHALYRSIGIARDDREARAQQALENFRFFGAPHAAIITTDKALGTYGVLDVGGYIAVVTLAAQALGIGMVPQAALAMHSDVVRDFFGLPEDRVVVAGMSFGYPDTEHPVNRFRTGRAPVEDAVEWVES